MFGFLSRSTSSGKGNEQPKTERNPSTENGGGFFSLTPPPNQNQNGVANSANEDNVVAHEEASGFSFMTEDSSASSFSFMQTEEQPSGFSFLTSGTTEQDNNATHNEPSSGFSFLSDPVQQQPEPQHHVHRKPSVDLLDQVVEAPQDIKLAKTAQAKAVKKKKRTSRVGFGREEDDEPVPVVSTSAALKHMGSLSKIIEADDDEEPHHHSGATAAHSIHAAAAEPVHPAHAPAAPVAAPQSTVHAPVASHAPADDEIGSEIRRVVNDTTLQHTIPDRPPSYSPVPPPVASDGGDLFSSMQVRTEPVAPVSVPAKPTAAKPIMLTTTSATTISTPAFSAPNSGKPSATSTPVPVAPEPAPVVEKKDVGGDSLQVVKRLMAAVSELSQLQGSTVQHHRDIQTSISSQNSRLMELRQQLAHLESEQVRFGSLEEFDRADALNDPIERTKEQMVDVAIAVEQLQESVPTLNDDFQKKRNALLKELEGLLSRLQESKSSLIAEITAVVTEMTERHKAEETKIRDEEDRIQLEKTHVQREQESLQKDLATTEDAIQTQSGDFYTRKVELEPNLLAVQMEIRQLEETLQLKRQEEQRILRELEQADTKIGEIRKKYDRQLTRIHNQMDTLKESKYEVEQEEAQLVKTKRSFEEQASKETKASKELQSMANSLTADISLTESFLLNLHMTDTNSIFALLGFMKTSSTDSAAAESSNFQRIQEEVEALQSEILSKQNKVNETQHMIDSNAAEMQRVAEQIPKLEADKKAHATNKRFKEAGIVAKDIKDLSTKKEELDARSIELHNELQGLEAEVRGQEEQLKELQKQALEAKKKEDEKRYQELGVRAKTVYRAMRDVQKGSSSQEVTDLSGEAEDKTISTYIKQYLHAELAILTDEMAAIQSLYGLETITYDAEEIPPPSAAVEEDTPAAESSAEEVACEVSPGSPDTSAKTVEAPEAEVSVVTPFVLEEAQEVAQEPSVTEEPTPAAVAEPPAAVVEESREELVLTAKGIVDEIQSMESEMEAASDHEDYDRAAEIFTDIEVSTVTLNQLLAKLQLTKEELVAL